MSPVAFWERSIMSFRFRGVSPSTIRPRGIGLIAVVNALAAALHIVFWTLAFLRLPNPAAATSSVERAMYATTYGFGIADVVWSFPLLAISAVGLWRMRSWGWLAAQMANVLWWYSFTVLGTRDVYAKSLSPGMVVFLPFVLFAFWAATHLWRHRRLFRDDALRA
jgi:hypothetical protein